ncbi:hypothetical protein [Aquitalea magnusonii]|uniref:Uncharacterized protein n=1 Tax=Aquitalea magnusonii TaxID=332411 RepID=A0A318J551_9NEIS|nr:hypothetical protein [Aquitalea magnusonii]PXX42251.1 hypothetical protein DFR38_12048 [Aquitalea magnusonii]
MSLLTEVGRAAIALDEAIKVRTKAKAIRAKLLKEYSSETGEWFEGSTCDEDQPIVDAHAAYKTANAEVAKLRGLFRRSVNKYRKSEGMA